MNTATRITLIRILLIPAFVWLAVYYGKSVEAGAPDERLRWMAVGVFLIASLSDAVDGWIARRFNQRSRLGAILDPLADKGLVLATLITLSVTAWSRDHRLPLWFPMLVITRDVLSIGGAFLIQHATGNVVIRPHWTGKVATATMMIALAWVMLHIDWLPAIVPVAVSSVFVVASGVAYIMDMLRQLHSVPEPPQSRRDP